MDKAFCGHSLTSPHAAAAPGIRGLFNTRHGIARDNTYTYHSPITFNYMVKSCSTAPLRKGAPDGPGLDRRLPILLRRAWFGLNQTFRRRIADLGLTPGQFTVLRTLTECGDMSQRELTEVMRSDANTIASLLSRMEAAGWIKRETHERDRRSNRLDVTAKGIRKLETVRPIALELQEGILAALPTQEREQFLKSLERIASACQSALNETEPDSQF